MNRPEVSGHILIIFGDNSLGGTSRSAYMAGKAWTSKNYPVAFLPFLPIHPERVSEFEALGPIHEQIEDVDWSEVRAVHLHHGSWGRYLRHFVRELLRTVNDNCYKGPLITNNIFAVRDAELENWPGKRATTVLGHWAAYQYQSANRYRRVRFRPYVVPNAQEVDFFRAPSQQERLDAKKSLDVGSDRTILRIGSPIMNKWSKDYVDLAQSVQASGARMIVVGCPPELSNQLQQFRNVHVLPRTSRDVEIRRLYWAADVFSANAERGESFGNVLLEALASGLPTVYRSRPYRDNTPWEFQDIPDFHFSCSRNSWIRQSLDLSSTRTSMTTSQASETKSLIDGRYGVDSTGERLETILTELEGASLSSERRSVVAPKFIGRTNSLKVNILHNPLIAIAKEIRLSRR